MKVRVLWEFDADVEDLDPAFVDIKNLAKDLAERELAYMMEHQDIQACDFVYEVVEEKKGE